MAEFCLECWNKINGTNDSERKYVLSKESDLCEGCGEIKPVIIMERKLYYMRILSPFIIVCKVIWRLIILPYSIIRYKKSKNKHN